MLARSGGSCGGASRIRVLLLCPLLLFVLVFDDCFLVDRRERVRVVRVFRATGRAPVGVVFLDAVPAPHAQAVPARARQEVSVRDVHGLAAERANCIIPIVGVVQDVLVGHDSDAGGIGVIAAATGAGDALQPR